MPRSMTIADLTGIVKSGRMTAVAKPSVGGPDDQTSLASFSGLIMMRARVRSRSRQLALLLALSCPSAAFGQVVLSDSAAFARAETLFWRAEGLIHSTDRAQLLQA